MEVSVSYCGKLVAAGCDRNQFKVWNLDTGDEFVLGGHLKKIRAVNFSKCGNFLVSGSNDGTLKIWELIKT